MSINNEIDFIMPWLDDQDPAWRLEKSQYDGKTIEDSSEERFREWGLFRYWFRSVERFAPWVRKVHIVTWGHLPSWLDVNHPKLNIVNHEDYIPKEWLPTFSVYPIELNFHRITDLAEQFVYFCDDMYLLREVSPEDFFKNGLPCASAALTPTRVIKGDWFTAPMNDIAIINANFKYRESVLGNLWKWINPKNGMLNIPTLLMLPFPAFYGFFEHHIPNSYLKSIFDEVWAVEEEVLSNTCSHKFRDPGDVNLWLMEYWQLVSGRFVPRSSKFGKAFYLGSDTIETARKASDCLRNQSCSIVCVNDGKMSNDDFAIVRDMIEDALSELFPEKSSFELD